MNLFWQAGFEHISYNVVDVFEIGELKELYLGLEQEGARADG